ncbi:hypothetical protein [Streptomyces griseoluteus]
MNQPLDLDAIDAHANAATPGPWTAVELPPNEHHKHPAHWVKTEYDEGNVTSSQVVADCPWRQADAEYIAAMRPEVGKALVAEVRRLRAAMEQIRHLHKDSPMGPCPVCIDADAAAAGGDGLVPYPCPTGRLAGAQDCEPASRP